MKLEDIIHKLEEDWKENDLKINITPKGDTYEFNFSIKTPEEVKNEKRTKLIDRMLQ